MPPGPIYSVRESTLFLVHISQLYPDLRRWDEIKKTFDLDVARDPRAFPVVLGTRLRAVGLNTVPLRTVYFWIDEDEQVVELVGIV